ncbi:MAG: hypothetical protein JW846_04630 [Dehalococcoidia bacterium]|nr:hypothetical protein [Dehalococcoidia bacterium]
MNQYDRFEEIREEPREADVEDTAEKSEGPEGTPVDEAALDAEDVDVTAPEQPQDDEETTPPDRPEDLSSAEDEATAATEEPAGRPEPAGVVDASPEPDIADSASPDVETAPQEELNLAEAPLDTSDMDAAEATPLITDSSRPETQADTEPLTDAMPAIPAEDTEEVEHFTTEISRTETQADTEPLTDALPAIPAEGTEEVEPFTTEISRQEAQADNEYAADTPVEDSVQGAGQEVAQGGDEQGPNHDVVAQSQPSQEGQEQASGREEGEAAHPRVVISAGTDEQSLEALRLCREKVNQLHLKMHPLAARYDNDKHVIIFFRADDKVDFRKLVRELSRILRARIEMRQLGPREQGKLCGLIGKCGYSLCCQTFLGQFAQSSIKMAKAQDLALNPLKISGVCGRLMCCLNFEQEHYAEVRSRMPKVNRQVETEFGPGRVASLNVLRETVTVQFETTFKEIPLEQVRLSETQG